MTVYILQSGEKENLSGQDLIDRGLWSVRRGEDLYALPDPRIDRVPLKQDLLSRIRTLIDEAITFIDADPTISVDQAAEIQLFQLEAGLEKALQRGRYRAVLAEVRNTSVPPVLAPLMNAIVVEIEKELEGNA